MNYLYAAEEVAQLWMHTSYKDRLLPGRKQGPGCASWLARDQQYRSAVHGMRLFISYEGGPVI